MIKFEDNNKNVAVRAIVRVNESWLGQADWLLTIQLLVHVQCAVNIGQWWIEVDWLQIINVASKLSLRSNVNVNSKENECEKQKEVQLNFVHEFEFKIVKRRLVENVGLIHKSK